MEGLSMEWTSLMTDGVGNSVAVAPLGFTGVWNDGPWV